MNRSNDVFLAVIASALVVGVLVQLAIFFWATRPSRRLAERLEGEMRPRLESIPETHHPAGLLAAALARTAARRFTERRPAPAARVPWAP